MQVNSIWEKIQTPRPNTTPNTNPGPPVSWNDPTNPDDPQAGYGYIANDTTKEETFFYHSDHLGSTSYITDDHANITQYDAYLRTANCWSMSATNIILKPSQVQKEVC